jgi:hypothetical protein
MTPDSDHSTLVMSRGEIECQYRQFYQCKIIKTKNCKVWRNSRSGVLLSETDNSSKNSSLPNTSKYSSTNAPNELSVFRGPSTIYQAMNQEIRGYFWIVSSENSLAAYFAILSANWIDALATVSVKCSPVYICTDHLSSHESTNPSPEFNYLQ